MDEYWVMALFLLMFCGTDFDFEKAKAMLYKAKNEVDISNEDIEKVLKYLNMFEEDFKKFEEKFKNDKTASD